MQSSRGGGGGLARQTLLNYCLPASFAVLRCIQVESSGRLSETIVAANCTLLTAA